MILIKKKLAKLNVASVSLNVTFLRNKITVGIVVQIKNKTKILKRGVIVEAWKVDKVDRETNTIKPTLEV